jgi:hypothetical protein
MSISYEYSGFRDEEQHPELSPELNDTLVLGLAIAREPELVNQLISRYPGTANFLPLKDPVYLSHPESPDDIRQGSFLDESYSLQPLPNIIANWAINSVDDNGHLRPAKRPEVLDMLQEGYHFKRMRTGSHWSRPATWRLFAIAPDLVADLVVVSSEIRATPATRGQETDMLAEEAFVAAKIISSGLVDARDLRALQLTPTDYHTT